MRERVLTLMTDVATVLGCGLVILGGLLLLTLATYAVLCVVANRYTCGADLVAVCLKVREERKARRRAHEARVKQALDEAVAERKKLGVRV